MNNFDTAFVLTRVLTTGTIMSIEKNDKELPGLEALIKKKTGRRFVSLFNSVTGAIHGALWGQGIGHGARVGMSPSSIREQRFASWLGLEIDREDSTKPYDLLEIDAQNMTVLTDAPQATTVVVDFTPLGFGPCAALVTDDELAWKRAERLKIFGAFDLRTMWTQQESSPDLEPGVQFNYRLSPLVAACVRLSLLQSSKGDA